MSWFDAPASRPAPAAPLAAFPPPRKASGSSWLDVPASPAPAASVPIVAEPAPAPSVPAAVVEPDPEPAPALVPSGVEAAADPVSAEPEPRPDPVPEEVGSEPVATPVFPLGRVFDNCSSRTSEPAGAEPGRGVLLEHPTVLPTAPAEPAPDLARRRRGSLRGSLEVGRDPPRLPGRTCATSRPLVSGRSGSAALPATPRTVARYLTRARRPRPDSVSTIDRRAAAIAYRTPPRRPRQRRPRRSRSARSSPASATRRGRPPAQKKALTGGPRGPGRPQKIPTRPRRACATARMVLLCFACRACAGRSSSRWRCATVGVRAGAASIVTARGRSKTDQARQGQADRRGPRPAS